MPATTNRLIHSKSPYLLQHAHNPIDWFPWGKEALDKAKNENKPIIVSIGYSACHWCHVMAHESFEDQETADWMNDNFVCIKIDREERPDLDNIYMDAIQVMGLQGGWPLNVFLMPNQKPFYGGTYFPNKDWKALLKNITHAFASHHDQLAESAEGFGRSIGANETEKYGLIKDSQTLNKKDLIKIVHNLTGNIDKTWGGMNRVPKFPMPVIWEFLLDFALLQKNRDIENDVLFTLKKIGMGGIYDHLRGGFARYSVDGEWFAPHFEKMLYDNGQLLSLYAKAYQVSGQPFYKEKIEETVDWLYHEMLDKEGAFYAALDADSEGEEGKFYTWPYSELEKVVPKEDLGWFSNLYNLKPAGNWEKGTNILFQTREKEKIQALFNMDAATMEIRLKRIKQQLLEIRNKRVRPGLDDKIISGWNGLVISGLTQAYWATESIRALEMAKNCGEFLMNAMIKEDTLFRSYKNGDAYTAGFLEDYAAVIQGFIDLYQVTLDEKWIFAAKKLMDACLRDFTDEKDGFFFYNNPKAEKLIANKKELFDNVIPASNSIMVRNLHRLGLFFYQDSYLDTAKNLLGSMKKLVEREPGYLSNWARTYLEQLVPTAEIAIFGSGAIHKAKALQKNYLPNVVIAAAEGKSKLPLLQYKDGNPDGNALIYVCFNKACQKPVAEIEEAIKQLPFLA